MASKEEQDFYEDLGKKANGAMKAAVANVIREHLRTGQPLAVWRDGKVAMISPEEAAVGLELDDKSDENCATPEGRK